MGRPFFRPLFDSTSPSKELILRSKFLQLRKGQTVTTEKSLAGRPYAENAHVRFDEREVTSVKTPRRGSLHHKAFAIRKAVAALLVFAGANFAFAAPPTSLTEGFESGVMPSGWSQEKVGTSAAEWSFDRKGDHSESTGCHGGTRNARIFYDAREHVTKLISPVLNLKGHASASLRFWYVNRSWGGDVDALAVLYRTSSSAAWKELKEIKDAHATWTQCEIDLPNLSSTYQVAFEVRGNYGYGVALDDVVVAGTGVLAWTNPYDGVQWFYTVLAGKATITGVSASPKYPVGYVDLPSTLGGNPVTAIGAGALEGCAEMTSVTIPDTVTVIGNNAFKDCTSLERVDMPSALVAVDVKDRCFSGCPAKLTIASHEKYGLLDWHYQVKDGKAEICYDDYYDTPTIPQTTSGSITVPATLGGLPVTGIGERAFSACDKLTGVTIPATVTSIGEWAFEGCRSLSLTVPATVTSIGDGAFYGCESMTDANGFVIVRGILHYYDDYDDDVEIPAGVTRIGPSAFEDCKMERVTIPDSVTSIGDFAFSHCIFLEDVDIPASVTSIGGGAFWLCYWLADADGFVIVRDVLYFYDGTDEAVMIPGGVTAIGMYAFYDGSSGGNDDVKSVTIPPSVTSIGERAFDHCSSLTEVSIPASVTRIGYWAFHDTGLSFPLKTVHVMAGDADRVKGLLTASGHPLGGITAFEGDVLPPCTITFNANGGSVLPTTRLVTGGKAIGALPEPVLAGYLFVGWFASLSGGEEVTATTIVTADATVYARWTEVTASTWFTRRDEALAEAKRTGKKVFLIRGRDTCGNTMFTKNTSCENPAVKGKLVAKCVLWYCNIDGPYGDESDRYRSGLGGYALPLVCLIDPNDPEHYLKRSTGPLDAAAILTFIADLPYIATSGPGTANPGTGYSGAHDSFYPGDLSGYRVLNPADIWDPFRASRAMTLMGAAYRGDSAVGVVELKVGKLKGREAKVSGTVTLLNGMKYTIKSKKCRFGDTLASTLQLDVKGKGIMRIAIGSMGGVNVFSGSLDNWHVQTANVGSGWGKATATASVEMDDLSMFPGDVVDELLPISEVATATGGRWVFRKAAGVKWAKKPGESDKSLIVDTSKGKTNGSGLKLTYTAKKGTFKGSFKVYELQGSKLKKYTVNVNGIVVDGVGYGEAICKRPVANWPVTVR